MIEDAKENPKYPIARYAPGIYTIKCSDCSKRYMGDKYSRQCETCAINFVNQQYTTSSQELKKLKNALKEIHSNSKKIEQILYGDTKENIVLNHVVSAIYFNDNSDYLKTLYQIVIDITGIEKPTEKDINQLFKKHNET